MLGEIPGIGHRCLGQLPGKGKGVGHQFSRRTELVDQADFESLRGGNGFAEEDHVQCLGPADHLGQSLGAAPAGNDAEVQLGEAQHDLGGVGHDPELAAQGQFQSTPQGKAVDGGDNGLFQPLEILKHTVTELVTMRNLVQAQIRIAEGYKLTDPEIGIKSQKDIELRGYAIQSRITTEDPKNNFAPDYGTIKSSENYERRFVMTFPNETLPKGRRMRTTTLYDRLTQLGAVWGDGRLTLVGPSHTYEALWVVERADSTWVSNSMPLAATSPASPASG